MSNGLSNSGGLLANGLFCPTSGNYDFLDAFVLASLPIVEAPEQSDVLFQGSPDDLRHLQPSSLPQFCQVLDVTNVKSDRSCLPNGLHTSQTLQGGDTILDVEGNAKVHQLYGCTTNDIQVNPEIPDSGTVVWPTFWISDSTAQSNSLPRRKVSPLETGRLGQKDLCVRVMDRLRQAEAKEVNLHFASDYRQSWITCSFLQKGLADAFVLASYVIYGVHPDFVWPNIVADRKARLGAEYHEWYTSDDILRPDLPKFEHPSSGQHKQSLVECLSDPTRDAGHIIIGSAQGCTPDEALCCPDSIPPRNADTHAAHGASLPDTTASPVSKERIV